METYLLSELDEKAIEAVQAYVVTALVTEVLVETNQQRQAIDLPLLLFRRLFLQVLDASSVFRSDRHDMEGQCQAEGIVY